MDTNKVINETTKVIKEIVEYESKTDSVEYLFLMLKATHCIKNTLLSLREKDPYFEAFSNYVKKVTVNSRNTSDLKKIMLYYKDGDIFDGKKIYKEDVVCRECQSQAINNAGDTNNCGFYRCQNGHLWITYRHLREWIIIIEK